MQIYKKKFETYFYWSLFLAFLMGYFVNFVSLLPGDILGKFNVLMSSEVGAYFGLYWAQAFVPTMIGFICGFLVFIIGLASYALNNDKGVYRNNEEHGSAKNATAKDLRKYADKVEENNIIFSALARMGLFNKRLPFKVQRNKNVFVLGDPGSGKTFTFVLPNLLQLHASFIVTDPKALLVRQVGWLLEKFGYTVKIFDLANLTNSDRFNVFKYIKTELDIDRVLEAITEGTKKGDNQGEDFWIKAEALLVRSLIAFLWFDGKDNNYTPHLGMIADMLRRIERKDKKVPSPVENWFEELNQRRPNNYAYKQWTLFNDLYGAETRMSVLAMAAGRFSVFDHEQVVDMIREDDMDIESWNEKKTAVFVAIPETNDTYNFLSAIFFATVAEVLRSKVDKVLSGETILENGKQLLHVRFIIDEFANIGRIPNIEKFLATFRSREMSITIIVQAIDQLKTMYKNGWAGIIATCSTLLYLGGNEESTLKFLSGLAGKQTISVREPQYGQRNQKVRRGKSQARDLYTPDEISNIGGDECLVFINKENVFQDKKYMLTDHPNAQYVADDYTHKYWYRYKRYMEEYDEWMDLAAQGQMIDHGVIEEEAA